MTSDPIVSHGRGGQGNIGPDDTEYVDGEIHREGDPSTSGAAYSAGRGGAGNIGSPDPAAPAPRTSSGDDVVPNAALVAADETYHSGRGGEGNAVVAGETKKKSDGLVEKLKRRFSVLIGRNNK